VKLYSAFQEYFGIRSPRCSQFGVSTIRSLFPQVLKPSGEITRTRRSNYWIRGHFALETHVEETAFARK
jgi:hypothetical protein